VNASPNPTIFAALAAAGLVIGAGVTFWQYGQMSDHAGRIAILRGEVQDEGKMRERLVKVEEDLSTSSRKLHHLELGVPTDEYVPTLLKELETTGRQSFIDVLGVRPLPKRQEPARSTQDKDGAGRPARKAYDELDIEVSGAGSYAAVSRFLDALQTFPKIAEVRSVTLTPERGAVGVSPKLNVTIQIRAFVFPVKKDESKPDAIAGSPPKVNHGNG
jgi:Tfp pilus assembly protein PilO